MSTPAPHPTPAAVPAPGELAEVDVQSIAFGGDGVARLADGRAVFIPFTAPGDRARIRLVAVQPRFARAELVTLLSPGPDRVTPTCPLFGRCGGCRYQHLAPAAQAAIKRGQLRDSLRRVGGLQTLPEVEDTGHAPAAYGYRNKITLHPLGPRGAPTGWGMVALDNTTILPVTACPLAHPDLNARLADLQAGRYPLPQPPSDQPDAPLVLRRAADGTVISMRDPAPTLLAERVLGHRVRVPAGSFFQVHPAMLDHLATWLRGALTPGPWDALVDGYCGAGVFSVALGDLIHQRIIGVESDAGGIHCAQLNADEAGLLPHASATGQRPAQFIAGDMARKLTKALRQLNPYPRLVVLLDPPRGGCEPAVLAALLAAAPPLILYVSCNPTTLARDLTHLAIGTRYQLTRLAAFDMFPHTAHLESVAVLTRLE